jgi:glycosyltransferase involved in cell wall biosynthesis
VIDRHLADLRPEAVIWWSLGGMSLSLVEQVRRAGAPALGVVGDDWMRYAARVDLWTRIFDRRPWLGPLGRLAGIPTRFEPGRAGRWLFVSNFLRRAAVAHLPLPDTGVVHPGIDPAMFPESPPGPWAWRLLYVGRIDPRKGIELAVEALAALPAEATLAIVGSGDDRHLAELRERAGTLGVGRRVSFSHAPRERLAEVYAEADAVIFPVTWNEPWGLVPIEAMSVGRPVVATGRGGSAEFLRDGENCLLFDPDEGSSALATALRRLAGDETLRVRLREGGRATAARITEDDFNHAVLAELEAVAARVPES